MRLLLVNRSFSKSINLIHISVNIPFGKGYIKTIQFSTPSGLVVTGNIVEVSESLHHLFRTGGSI